MGTEKLTTRQTSFGEKLFWNVVIIILFFLGLSEKHLSLVIVIAGVGFALDFRLNQLITEMQKHQSKE